jgi:hypothetical protein
MDPTTSELIGLLPLSLPIRHVEFRETERRAGHGRRPEWSRILSV